MHLLSLLPLILTLTILTSAQKGTITLTLATSSDETATTLSLPFNTLFTPTAPAKGIAIHVSSGTNVPLAQDEITCQCFADAEGTQALGETFTNDFPGAELAQQEEPVQIGSILCSDRAGLEEHFTTKGVVKAAAAPPRSPLPSTTTTSSSAPPPPQRETSQPPPPPTAFLLFALSTDPSDDSSSQMPVPISGAALIPTTGNKRAGSVKLVSVTGMRDSDAKGVVCQAFGDEGGAKPLGVKAFGLEEEEEEGRVLDEEGDGGLRDVKAVGCVMLGDRRVGFGGMLGLVGSSE
ncbi:MAG: hypothetical protein Q9185_004048 [Variospora sp. 1 TL-2023]